MYWGVDIGWEDIFHPTPVLAYMPGTHFVPSLSQHHRKETELFFNKVPYNI